MSKTIGIDLGTTNSCVSVFENGQWKVIVNAEGRNVTPSIVAFTDDGEIVVGDPAKNQAVTNAENTFYAVKRLIGRRFDDPEVQKMIGHTPFKIVAAENGDAWVETKSGEKKAPAQISAEVLKKMKETAEAYLGEKVTNAVITVPAYFNDSQRQATKDAGAIAGLEVKRIINEPTAAALAYGHGSKTKGGKVAVFDLGGGTFDVSILEMGDGVFEVKAANGDTFLGGEDFDRRVMEYLIEEFKKQSGIDLGANQKDPMAMQALQRLKEAAEKAKIELSSKTQTDVNLPFLAMDSKGPKNLLVKITRAKLEELVADLIEKTKEPTRKALADAGIKIEEIEDVILVGGMTRMPKVRETVKALFGKEPNQSLNPDEVVGAGAAVQGGILSGAVTEILLLDVIPLSLGIETAGGVMTVMIPRNTTIPTKKSEVFSTAEDGQDAVTIRVYQGESPIAEKNKLMGEFHLVGIPPAPKGKPQIEVTFNINANGLLVVTAMDKATKKEQKVEIQANGGLTEAEVAAMIKQAEASSAEDAKRREVIDLRNEADSELSKLKKALEELGDSAPATEKEAVLAAQKTLEKAVAENADAAGLRAGLDGLRQAALALGSKIYDQAAAQQQPAGGGSAGTAAPRP